MNRVLSELEKSQRRYFGSHSLAKLPEIIARFEAKQILLVRGGKSYFMTGADQVIDSLPENIRITSFSGFAVNPDIVDVYKALNLMRGNQPDLIIAIGGGSAMDIAKLISVAMLDEHKDFEAAIRSSHKMNDKLCPVIAVPTTAGTGSENTSFAVVYIDKVKFSLAGPAMLPDIALIDPRLSDPMPARLTAECGMDALSQAIESFWSVRSTEESQEYSKVAIEHAWRSLKKAVIDPCESSRNDMSIASDYAGRAINITTTTAAHALSYPITTIFGLAHGHAVACTLPEFFVINADPLKINSRLSESIDKNQYRQNIQTLCRLFDCNTGSQVASKLYQLYEEIDLNVNLKNYNFDKAIRKKIIASINVQRLSMNPVVLDEKDLQIVLQQPGLNGFWM